MKKFFNQLHIQSWFSREEGAFTLIEVMVAVSIFAIIITIGIGSLMTIFSTLQRTRSDRQTLDSVSYMMDTMTRQIRTAKSIEREGSNKIKIKNQDDYEITFQVVQQDSNNDKSTDSEQYFKLQMVDDSGTYDLSPHDFKITEFNFEYYDSTNNSQQGILKINLAGVTKSGRKESESPIALQTIVSKRRLDYSPVSSNQNGNGSDDSGSDNDGG
mgnify:FL=1